LAVTTDPFIHVNLPIGLAGVLIGAYSLIARREAIPQLVGIFAMENGAFCGHRNRARSSPDCGTAVHFRTAIHRQRKETHVVDRLFLKPVGATMQWMAGLLAGMHHGRLNAYVAYVLAFLLLILLLYRLT
jgi:hypothetical protein